ncbi:MAG: hypothetical protein ABJF67_14760 [Aurantimonas coralicida]|jgi:hypothetical protein|uniref:hypothetical protein n=1 Tax=Aurantimonas TaxID=182269 RepID=UPI00041BD3EB|nr:hypothetical protein [Aurantimonas coralicida]MDE0921818.1 hypothetical protein [Aurantimonas coralicida]MDX1731388.1 hypothetical protein [Aurantimonas coralicida]
MKCPICEGEATLLEPEKPDQRAIHCERCGEYRVSTEAEAKLHSLTPHQRLQALRYAETITPTGRRPFIAGLG